MAVVIICQTPAFVIPPPERDLKAKRPSCYNTRQMKACFETFGCRLNKAEALQMEADYLAGGWELTSCREEADLFVVRGCSVTAKAQADCEKFIAHLRRTYPNATLHVCGCLPNLPKKPTLPKNAGIPTRTARAYLKVQDGCSGRCTFCIVPQFRGPSRSVPFTDVLDRARRFLDAGYHELVVTGCNLALYASEGKRLPDLLAALAELSGTPSSGQATPSEFRMRLGSLEPGAGAQAVVAVMSEHANICRFLHLPIQSGSDRILAAMNRPYRADDIAALVRDATRLMPGVGLGCDLMTGFPGESDADFAKTKSLLEALPFSNAHVFPYSERPGTPAAGLAGVVPAKVRNERAAELSALANIKRNAYARSFVGKTVDVVVESHEKTEGWTDEYLRCEAEGSATRKTLVRVLVTKADGDRLRGVLSDR